MVNAGQRFLVLGSPCTVRGAPMQAGWLVQCSAVRCIAVQCMCTRIPSHSFVHPCTSSRLSASAPRPTNDALARAPEPADSARTVDASPRLVERPCRPNSSPPPPLLSLVTMVSRGLFFAALLAMCGTAQGKLSRALVPAGGWAGGGGCSGRWRLRLVRLG